MEFYRFGFVIEQTMGHAVYHRNLARQATRDATIRPTWIPIPCWEDDRWARVPVVRRNMSLSLSLRARDRLRRMTGLDGILFHTQATAMFSASLSRRLPVVVSLDATPRNVDTVAAGYSHRPDSDGPIGRLKARWYRLVFARAAGLTTWNRWARDSLVRDYGADADKVVVIPPGLDLDAWRPAPRAIAPRRPARILFVGSDFGRKGGHVLLDAFRAGLSGRCELDIVTGDAGPEGGGPVRVHRGLNHDGPGLRRLFDEADLFVLPTLADCMPLAIIEAMAAGLPVVATRVGAIPEQVADGETGLLVAPGDAAALAEALGALIEDPDRARALGDAGRRRAEALFNGERNYRALIDLMKRCVAGHRGPRPTRPEHHRQAMAPETR